MVKNPVASTAVHAFDNTLCYMGNETDTTVSDTPMLYIMD